MFRTTATLEFVDGVSDAAKQTFFAQNSMSVLGVTSEGVYFVAIPDPGLSITDFDAYFALLAAKPEILRALPAFHTGIKPIMDSRFPADAVARGDWFTQSPFLWAMKAIRAPLAWGCETGTYGSSQVKVGLLEWAQDPIHPELLASTPAIWGITGWTGGRFLCQGKSNYVSTGEDSGAPVITAFGDGTAWATGLHWGSNVAGDRWFSSMDAVLWEFYERLSGNPYLSPVVYP
jgi:hypothetical protein